MRCLISNRHCLSILQGTCITFWSREKVTHHRHNHRLTKLYLEDVKADSAAFINVWVVHRGGEPDQWDNSNGLVCTPVPIIPRLLAGNIRTSSGEAPRDNALE